MISNKFFTTKEGSQPGQEEGIEAGKIIRIDEGQIKDHLSGMVLRMVEETLNVGIVAKL